MAPSGADWPRDRNEQPSGTVTPDVSGRHQKTFIDTSWTSVAPSDAQRNATRYREELQIALLDTNQRGEIVVAGGPWAGVRWPDGMLVGPPGRLGDLICPIMNTKVQIEIKEKFGEWEPDLPPREKDQVDIAYLRAALSRECRTGQQ